MKKIDSFINQYSLSKTLQFKLIPCGKTAENFAASGVLEQDTHRADSYQCVKEYIDEYHRVFIDEALSQIQSLDVQGYADLYYKTAKTDADKKQMRLEEDKLRKVIAAALTGHPDYNKQFNRDMITELLPSFLDDDNKKSIVAEFDRFTSYFNSFHDKRKNMYTEKDKATGIAYRCINDNLPKFLDNIRIFLTISTRLPQENMLELSENFAGLLGYIPEEAFHVENFVRVLSQNGISRYNEIIGGYTLSDGAKIKGLNEYINLYNQTHAKTERLPQMKPLFKQILSDKNTVSFIPEKFQYDDEVITSVREFYEKTAEPVTKRLAELFADLGTFNQNGIFLKSGTAISDFSNQMFKNWNALRDIWRAEYDLTYTGKARKGSEKYVSEQDKAWKRIVSFSLSELQHLMDIHQTHGVTAVIAYFKNAALDHLQKVAQTHAQAANLLSSSYTDKPKRLAKNDEDIALLKNLLDALKELEWLVKPFLGAGSEDGKDAAFYSELEDCYCQLRELDRLYDKVRNYITKKPYSTDKIKLNFDNPTFLSGWAAGNEFANSAQLFRKDGLYYLGVMDKALKTSLPAIYPTPNSDTDVMEKMVYQQAADPSKDIPNLLVIDGKTVKKNGRKEKTGPNAGKNLQLEQLRNEYLPPEINEIRKRRSFSASSEYFSRDDLTMYINYYMERTREYYSSFDFHFKQAEEYASFKEFTDDVDNQAYQLRFEKVSYQAIMDAVDSGALYLFQIYSKDFSPHSKGTPNLHTLYFKMLFDERNMKNVVYKLDGGAEMFYRYPSIRPEERIIHPKNQPIKNKNPHTCKPSSTFEYDLIKDKRFTEPQFSLHLSVRINFHAIGNEQINRDVRMALKSCEHNYIIGINRGERHLVYITVIDEAGNIVEQFSGNKIVNSYNGVSHTMNYYQKLDKKEKERMEARQNWSTIENIKDLKEGYISQLVHKVCELVIKYDAVVAMENLDSGFKNSRAKVEKQVYQKFEKMLIDKLNYFADKRAEPSENGGLLRAYQLTEKFNGFEKMGFQNGFIFYVPAWHTAKIDPTTGFVDLINPEYTNIADAKRLINTFKQIRFNEVENMFELTFDYHDFPKGSVDATGVWTICTNADRVMTYRDENANGSFSYKRVNLTNEWINLFESAEIDYHAVDLRKAMQQQEDKSFFESFICLLRLTLQMRNYATGTEDEFLISPVRNSTGSFFDSRHINGRYELPVNYAANGAYNIARKAAWIISVLKNTPEDELSKARIAISNRDWLLYVQSYE